jgi:WD40 repeat protein
VWDTTAGSKLYTCTAQATTFSSNGQVSASRLAWSPDGTRLAVGTVQLVDVWNAADGNHICTYHGHEIKNSYGESITGLAWSPDSKCIVSAISNRNDVHVWDATDGSRVFIYKGHTYVVFAVDWSPTSNYIASASGDNTVQVWNATDGSNASFYHGHDRWVNTLVWSPDGKRIATGGQDKTVQVWSRGRELF